MVAFSRIVFQFGYAAWCASIIRSECRKEFSIDDHDQTADFFFNGPWPWAHSRGCGPFRCSNSLLLLFRQHDKYDGADRRTASSPCHGCAERNNTARVWLQHTGQAVAARSRSCRRSDRQAAQDSVTGKLALYLLSERFWSKINLFPALKRINAPGWVGAPFDLH